MERTRVRCSMRLACSLADIIESPMRFYGDPAERGPHGEGAVRLKIGMSG